MKIADVVRERERESNNLEEKENVSFHVSSKEKPNCRGFHCLSVLQITYHKNTGITLIALIITIIILLILAGVTINFTLGENGILKRAKQAGEGYKNAYTNEMDTLANANNYINNQNKSEDEDMNARLESDIGVKHVTNDEWIADIPTDNWFANEKYYRTKWKGEGTKESPYLISSEEQLAGLSYKVANGEQYEDVYFKLENNLSMGKHIWVPIGGRQYSDTDNGGYYKRNDSYRFKGNFDGNNCIISGLYFDNISESFGYNVGLFGKTYEGNNNKALIENLGIEDSKFSGCLYIGGICGDASYAKIINCYNTGTIIGKGYIGGIAGRSYDILDSFNTGNVFIKGANSNQLPIGGIVGELQSRCINVYNTGNIEVEESEKLIYVGGIAGYNGGSASVDNSFNAGDVTISKSDTYCIVGGICGLTCSGSFRNCYNVGKINNETTYTGGIVGSLQYKDNSYDFENNYCLQNEQINNSIKIVRNINFSTKVTKKMLAYFSSQETTEFTYTDETTELEGYQGDLLTKLNHWVELNNNKGLYRTLKVRTWKVDTQTGYPILEI